MNNKIGLLTFHRALNYGAVLQAYSLFSYLHNLGYEVEVIDFLPDKNWKDSAIFLPPKNRSAVIRDMYSVFTYSFLRKRKNSFSGFLDSMINMSKERNISSEQLPELITRNNYSAIICGSDQIWNAKLPDSDISFLLPTVEGVRKIAYAASIGKGCFEDFNDNERVKRCLLGYDYISVREKSTSEKLRSFVDYPREVSLVVDPTLLIDELSLRNVAGKRQIEQPYIFLYTVIGRKDTIEAAEALAQRVDLPVYTMFSGRPKKWWLKYRNKTAQEDVGPSGFLSMIRDAEFIVTDSFHGALCSIIYQKNFFFIKKRENGMFVRDERIAEVCDAFLLNDRYIEPDRISDIPLASNVDWKAVAEKHCQLKEKSEKYLKTALIS